MKFIATLMAILTATTPVNVVPTATVTDIHGDYAVVEFVTETGKEKVMEIPTEDITNCYEGMDIPLTAREGKFYASFPAEDCNGLTDIFYQFKSDDDVTWWLLNTAEVGHVPNFEDKYILYFSDNGTDKTNIGCDCLEKYGVDDCECELYDDIFFAVEKIDK